MKTRETIAGKTWVVTSPNGCTVTQTSGSTTITTEVPANVQTLVLAQTGRLEISDDAALVTEVGGSAELIYRMESGEGGSCDCEPLTAEAIQAVMPVAWGTYDTPPKVTGSETISIGGNAQAFQRAQAIGLNAKADGSYALAVGTHAKAKDYSNALGSSATCENNRTICIGHAFPETIDGVYTWFRCTTEGTGSITIGAGANTLNNGDTESSNSITIGCKASNSGADSVVIGAGASNTTLANVAIGVNAKVKSRDSVAVGHNTEASSWRTTAVGQQAKASGVWSSAFGSYSFATAQNSTTLGMGASAIAMNATAVGYYAAAADFGVMVFRSEAEDGTYTQLYFSGANTPLANTYHDGAPMLGYVTKDSAGNIVAAGTRSLIDLLTDNSTFAPASLDENGEWVQPTVFHPSDLDLPPQEAPTEEEYTPMPVYPIVEPEMTEEV